MNHGRDSRRLTLALLAIVGAILLAGPAGARAAATPGQITINGVSVTSSTTFNLDQIGAPTIPVPGQPNKGWPLRKILLYAQDKTGGFEIDNFEDPVEVSRTGGAKNLKVDEDQVAKSSYDRKLPVYFIDAQGNTSMREPGGTVWTYDAYDPQIFVPATNSALDVTISPGGPIRIKAGDTQRFKAHVTNAGGASVSLSWTLDSKPKQSGGSADSGRFEYEFRDQGSYEVAVFATAKGKTQGLDLVKVIVGKAKKKPQKKDKNEPDDTDDSENYDPGYGSGYDDPYGTGTGPGSGAPSNGPPSTGSPQKKQPKKDRRQQPVDDGLETVSGELIDPGSTATVIPSTDSPQGATEEAEPAEDEGGGGLPGGVKAAFGIGALLGLGGLAEAGAFSGLFRRFRYRL